MTNDYTGELQCEDLDKFIILPKYILLDTRLKGSERDVYCLLKSYCFNTKNHCFPGIGRMAAQLGVGERTIRNAVNGLIEHGLVDRLKRPNRTNLYVIKRVEEVYLESVSPWKYKPFYEEILRETERKIREAEEKEISACSISDDESDGISDEGSVFDDKKRSKVEAAMAEKRKKGTVALLRGVANSKEQAEVAKTRARKRKRYKDMQAQKRKNGEADFDEPDDVEIMDKPLTTNDVHAVWMDLCPGVFGTTSKSLEPWGGKERKMIKRLNSAHTPETVIFVLEHVLSHWATYRDDYDIKGDLTPGLFSYYCNTWKRKLEISGEMEEKTPLQIQTQKGEFSDDGDTRSIRGIEL